MPTLPHVHLLLNHFPTVGTVIAFGVLLLSIVRKNDGLKRVALEIFCVIALLTVPAYLSGIGTQIRIEQLPGVSIELMQRHHDAALTATLMMVLTGGAAWLGLWQFRRAGRQSAANSAAVLVLSVLTMAGMARTATMGGEIRHPEILLDPEAAAEALAAAGPGWLTATSVAAFVNERIWVWPAMETLHFIGLWLLFGVVVLVNGRVLGLMPQASFASLHRLLPWAVLGLGVNVLTGMMFVIANPGMYAGPPFYWKIVLLMLAGANLLYLTAFDEPWEIAPGSRATLTAKAMSAASIALWI